MGLDNYWYLPAGRKDPTKNKEFRLYGGMFSGNGQGSFRGGVYEPLIKEATGDEYSLYSDILFNKDLIVILEALNKFKFRVRKWSQYDIDEKQFEDLKKMFELYIKADAILISWY